jgi:hypothetical protein
MKFRLGDSVRVINRRDYNFDKVGRVTTIDKSSPEGMSFRVTGIDPSWPLWYSPHELILAEKEDNR